MNTRTIFLTLLTLLVSGSLFATPELTKEERSKAIDLLKKTQKELASTVKGLSETQLNFKPNKDTWSVAEVIEHIAISEQSLSKAITMTLASGVSETAHGVSDDQVLAIITSRENKVKTRPDLVPSNQFGSAKGSLEAFNTQRKANIAMIKSTDEDMRGKFFEFPFGMTDTYQIMLFLAGHSQRHTDQIKEVMAHESFPG